MIKIATTFAAALLMAATTTAQSDLDERDLPEWDVALVAHRGLAPGLSENTLAAFEDAVSRGVGVIEIDLRGTADGAVVIMHDETVDRTTARTGDVTALTLEQIEALDAGSNAGDAYAVARVPTYDEVLEFA